MKRNLNKCCFLMTMLSLSSLVLADGKNQKADGKNQKNGMQGLTVAGNEWVDPSARTEVGMGWFVTADVFVWIAHEDGLTPTITNNKSGALTSVANVFNDAEFDHLDFEWDLGFRLGAGCNLAHDEWDIYANWTHFVNRAHLHSDEDASASRSTELFAVFSGLNVSAAVNPTEAESDWKLRLDIVDFDMGRKFFTGHWLSVRPFFGLRAAWIRQHLDIAYDGITFPTGFQTQIGQNTPTDYVKMKNNYWGVGPRAGVDAQFAVAREWSFFGDAAISILYGRFHVNQFEKLGAGEAIGITNSGTKLLEDNTILGVEDRFRASRAVTDLVLGLRYEHLFTDRALKMTVNLAWEHHLFFDQNQLKHITATFDPSTTNPISAISSDWDNNLSTQGWTIDLRFDF